MHSIARLSFVALVAGLAACGGSRGSSGNDAGAVQDSTTIPLLVEGAARSLVRLPGRPADIGIDPRRGRVAVPYVALNRVEPSRGFSRARPRGPSRH